MRHIHIICIIVSIVSVSCNGSVKSENKGRVADKTEQRVPAANMVNIVEPRDGSEYRSGDDIMLEMSLRGNKYPDSVRVFFDGTEVAVLKGQELGLRIKTANSGLGKIPLKIMAYEGNKRPQILTHFVTLLSDIQPVIYGYRVINDYPHDITAYTQGLLVYNGQMYESTGGEGKSSLRKVELETGKILKIHNLDSKFFGEGLTNFNDQLYQLTWQNNVGFVYDMESFREINRIHYTTQGWGLTTDGSNLIMSDGTNKIYFFEPGYFTVISTIEVYDNENPVWQLNELEYINGEIWANIYTTDRIARIDPATGKVLAYIDLSGILPREYVHPELAELNGIAWDNEKERLFVTGKNWPRLFEISLVSPR